MFSIPQKIIAPLLVILVIISMVVFNFVLADVTGTLRPTADGGEDVADWKNPSNAGCNGVDCYTEVDESSGASCTNSDGDTSYIKSDTSGTSQTFDIDGSSIPDGYTISQIDITICARRAVTGVVNMETRRCVDDVCTSSGSSITLTDSYLETTQSHSGLSIEKSASTDIEIGVINTSAKTIQVSQVSADITYAFIADTTAPSAVSDLALSGATANSIDLDWTAPGDDAGTGTATTYDIRYSTSAIDDGNWDSATQATSEPTPSVAGTSESMTVPGLFSNTTYYFAIKTSDEIPNESTISNVPSLATTVSSDSTAPSAISNLALSGATASSINLSWTAPGDDAGSGTASTYDVRYSTATITDLNWGSATQATSEPTPSVAGSSESMTVSSLSAETTYYFAIKTSDEVPIESTISNVPSLATSAAASVSIPTGGSVAPSKIHLSGQAYPGSKIEILRKGSLDEIYKNIPIESSVVNADGTFSTIHLGLLGTDYLVALRVEDKDGRKTGIISFNVNLVSGDLVVENIFLPPTVGFEDNIVKKGGDVHILGYAAANNIVELEIDDTTKETTSNADGFYELVMNTNGLDAGSHTVRARQIASTTEEIKASNFSISHSFKLSSLSVPLADFDKDSKIGITDWSIFLFRWGAEELDLRSKIDLDGNGTINIADFSIFLRAFSI